MTEMNNQDYLKTQQYKTPDNLQARINIHRFFGKRASDETWTEWVFNQMEIQPGMRILELGCGKGEHSLCFAGEWYILPPAFGGLHKWEPIDPMRKLRPVLSFPLP